MRGDGFGVPGRNGGCVPLDAGMAAMMMAGQCTPHFLFDLSEKKTGRARSKRKERFGGSGRIYASLLPPAREGWHSLAEVRDGNARPLGKPPARGSWGYLQPPSPLPLALPHRSVSGSEKRSRGNAMTTPTPSAPSATGRQFQKPQKAQACPTVSPNRSRHRSAAPPCARRAAAPECAKRFSLWTVHGPFLFWQDKREMGGASRWTSPPAGAESPVAAVRRPISGYLRLSLRPTR